MWTREKPSAMLYIPAASRLSWTAVVQGTYSDFWVFLGVSDIIIINYHINHELLGSLRIVILCKTRRYGETREGQIDICSCCLCTREPLTPKGPSTASTPHQNTD